MSKWVQIRDSIEDALKVDAVSKNMKADFVTWLGAEGTDFAQKAVDSINEECKKMLQPKPVGVRFATRQLFR